MMVMQLPFTYLPQANRIFQSAPIGWADWAKKLLFALMVYILIEFEKTLRLRKKAKSPVQKGNYQ